MRSVVRVGREMKREGVGMREGDWTYEGLRHGFRGVDVPATRHGEPRLLETRH